MYESTIHSKYKGNFEVSLYGEDEKNPLDSLSKWDKAYFTFQFERNNVIADGSTDIYKINVPNGCMIIRKYTTISNGGILNTIANTITYNNSPYSNEVDNTNTVVMQCTVDKLVNTKKQVIASVEVEEIIGEKTFTYMDGIFEQTLKDYYEKHPLPIQRAEWKQTETEKYLLLPTKDTATEWSAYLPINKAPLTDYNFLTSGNYAWFRDNNGNTVASLNNLYDIFNVVWLQHILTIGSSYKDEIISYVKDTYPDETSIKDDTKKLPGLKVTKYPTTDGFMWKYEIEENFVGYARTAKVDFTENNYMYFSTTDSDTLNEAFKLYLDMYPYQGVDNKAELKNLVDQYENGVSDILKLANANGDIYIDGKLVFHYEASDNRLELVKESVEEPDTIIRVPFKDSSDKMIETFESELLRIYGTKISSDAIQKIQESTDILTSLTKYATRTGKQDSYSEYFIVQDDQEYLLINVSSTGIEYTEVTVSNLDAKEEYDVNDINKFNKILSINFSDSDNAELLKIINALDKHFIGNEIHEAIGYDNYLYGTIENGITHVEYTIPTTRAYASYTDDTELAEMAAEFSKSILDIYGSIISKETLDSILSPEKILAIQADKNIPVEVKPGVYMTWPVLLNDYTPGYDYNMFFIVPGKGSDIGKYFLFNVYSGGYNNVYTSISELASTEGDGTVNFTLSNKDRRKLTRIVRSLDYYFGQPIHSLLNNTTVTVSYPITSTASVQDSIAVEEVSTSFKTTKTSEKYLELKEVSDENIIDEKLNSITEDEDENKKNLNTQNTEAKNTTEETEETSSDDSYVPSSNASNVDAVPSSDGGTTNTTSSITNEVIGVNSSPTSGISLVEAG